MYTLVKFKPAYLAIHCAFAGRKRHGRESLPRALVLGHLRSGHRGRQPIHHPKARSQELKGLVYGYTTIPSEKDLPMYKRPIFWAGGVAIFFVVLQWAVLVNDMLDDRDSIRRFGYGQSRYRYYTIKEVTR